MDNGKTLRPFGMRDKIGYAFGDFGCNMSFAFINSYLMLFYVTCMKINPKHFAILILLGKIFDAINDPIIGGLCDATKPGKDGKFKPWIMGKPRTASFKHRFVYLCAECPVRSKSCYVPRYILSLERCLHKRKRALRLYAELHHKRPRRSFRAVNVAQYRRYVCSDSDYDITAPFGL